MIMMSKQTPNEICGACTNLCKDKTHKKSEMTNQKVKDHLGDLSFDGWVLTKQILKKRGVRLWTRFIWLSSSDKLL
jgi:hypothetical protein